MQACRHNPITRHTAVPYDDARHSRWADAVEPARYIAGRAATLHKRLNFVADRASRGDLDGVEIEDGKLYIARIPLVVPDAARDLALRLNGMLPRARITEVLRVRWERGSKGLPLVGVQGAKPPGGARGDAPQSRQGRQ